MFKLTIACLRCISILSIFVLSTLSGCGGQSSDLTALEAYASRGRDNLERIQTARGVYTIESYSRSPSRESPGMETVNRVSGTVEFIYRAPSSFKFISDATYDYSGANPSKWNAPITTIYTPERVLVYERNRGQITIHSPFPVNPGSGRGEAVDLFEYGFRFRGFNSMADYLKAYQAQGEKNRVFLKPAERIESKGREFERFQIHMTSPKSKTRMLLLMDRQSGGIGKMETYRAGESLPAETNEFEYISIAAEIWFWNTLKSQIGVEGKTPFFERKEIHLTDMQVNRPVDEGEFSLAGLGAPAGTKVTDNIRNVEYRWEPGKE